MQQLQIEGVAIKHRRARHPKLNIKPAEAVANVELPDLFAIAGVAGEHTSAEKHPHMLAIR